MTSYDHKTALGTAVSAIWGQLPAQVQHDLFEAAVRAAGEATREELAVFLHQRHPRTVDGWKKLRDVPEPDSLGGD
ncbi:hypothetical protein BH11PSE3_BH11PSE3_40370 [soil metagenome]